MKKSLFILFFISLGLILNAQTNPTTSNNTVSTNEDVDKVFAPADFNYNDADGDPFTQIIIKNLETVGSLYLDANLDGIIDGGEDVVDEQVILVSDFNKLKFKPNPDENGAGYDQFRFQVHDGNDGYSGTSRLTIDVTPINDDPTITTNTGITVAEGSVNNIISDSELETTDLEQNAGSLTYTLSSIPANGTLYRNVATLSIGSTFTQDDINNNRIKYTHDGSETNSDSFTFVVDDGAGGNTVVTAFAITITPTNDDPTLTTNTGKTVNEGATNQIIPNTELRVTDVDNTPLETVFTLTVIPSNGTLYNGAVPLGLGNTFTQADINSNNLKYSHDGTETVADLFKFTVADGAGGNIAESTFNITIVLQNDAPVVTTNNGKTVNEGDVNQTILNTELETTDIDNTPAQLTYTLSSIPANGTLTNGGALGVGSTFTQTDINSNNLKYTHDGTETITDAFTFSVADGAGGTTVGTTFNITITPVNDDPILATNTGKTVNEGATNQIIPNTELQVTDEDNTPVETVFTLTVIPSNGTLYNGAVPLGLGNTFTQADINSNNLKYSHDGTETVADLFKFTVADGAGGNIAESTFNITIVLQNDAPVVTTNNGKTVNEGDVNQTILNTELETTDIDNTPAQLTYTLSSIPANGTLTNGGPALGVGSTFTQTDINSNNLKYTHDGTETITDAFTFSVADGAGGTTPGTTFNITITPVNDDPVLTTNTGKTVNEGATNQIIPNTELQVTDEDNTPVETVFTLTVIPSNGTLYNGAVPLGLGNTFTQADINSNNLKYSHDGTETVADLFKFTVADGAGGNIAESTFNITIVLQNDVPVVTTNNGKTVNEGDINQTILNTELETTDIDNTPAQLTYTLSSIPANGTLTNGGPALGVGSTFTQTDINSNNLKYTHDGTETVSDAFSFTVADGAGGTTGGTTFNITITPVNDAPTINTNTGKTVNEEATNEIISNTELEITDTDNTPAEIIYTLTTVPANGTLSRSGTPLVITNTFTQADINSNSLTYSHDGSETVADLFRFVASDGVGGNIADSQFDITITPQNDEPIFTSIAITVGEEGVLYTYNIVATDSDLPADVLTITAITKPAWLVLTDNGNGTATLSGTPPHGCARNNPIVLQVNDGSVNVQQAYTLIISLDIIVDVGGGGDYATIQEGIDASINGDIISVQPGTYTENINFDGKDIQIIGNEADPTQVTIDGGASGAVVTFNSGETNSTVLSGFTLTNGSGQLGLGSTNTLHAPASGYYGGGIFIYQSSPTLRDLIIEGNNLGTNNNHGGSGSAIYIGDGCNVTIEGNMSVLKIQNNSSNVYRGGGICIDDSQVILNNVEITNNSAGNYGGGIAVYNSDITISNIDITGNSVDGLNGSGGGIFSINSTITNGVGVNVSGNSATVWNNNSHIIP